MEEYQKRLVNEAEELRDRLTKLRAFINFNEAFDKLSDLQKSLMTEQTDVMEQYLQILEKRLELEK